MSVAPLKWKNFRRLRKDKADTKRIDAPPPDVTGDLDDMKKDQQGDDFDLRKAAKQKAAADKAQ